MLIPVIQEKDKTPFTDLPTQKAFIHKDAVYLFNPFTNCISTYCLLFNGFSYSVVKYDLNRLIQQMNFIWLSRGARELDVNDFNSFVKQITALQEQSHLIKPLTPFQDFVDTIITNYGLKVSDKLNGMFNDNTYISNPEKGDK